MPFDMYGDVILTRDVTERGLSAGDVGTVVERHLVPGVPEERLLGRVLRHDRGHGGGRHAAGERPAPAHTSRSAGRASPQRLKVGLAQEGSLMGVPQAQKAASPRATLPPTSRRLTSS
jgi:hypothetical protein